MKRRRTGKCRFCGHRVLGRMDGTLQSHPQRGPACDGTGTTPVGVPPEESSWWTTDTGAIQYFDLIKGVVEVPQ